jgi:ubiquinol-cytochrome c reductase cytochrome b subunit/menaquinol-cytochrome c reductase cytochrome b/c subunit
MTDHDYHQHDYAHPEPGDRISDQRRAFLLYKQRVAEHGKPFFPHGTYHDVIAATVTIAILIALSTMWFSMANCDSWWNPGCDRVSTPLQQEQYTPDHPGEVQKTKSGAVDEEVDKPLLGLLYEEKADPATTSYHPRPEWYFYFLFYLLIIFANPQLVVLGTIIVPTIWLMMLLVWPFVDRKKERRPSRRPVAMAAMVLTAVTLLTFTYKGSQSGKETGGPEGISEASAALPGYSVLFGERAVFETCGSCHVLGGAGGGAVGPDLSEVGTRYDSADDLVEVLANGLGGGAMPVKGGSDMTDEEAAQVAAFLSTLGNDAAAADAAGYGIADWNRVTGTGGEATGTDTEARDDAADTAAPATPG